MTLDEFDDIYYEYNILADQRNKYLNHIILFLNKLKETRGYLIEEIEKHDNHVSLKFMDHNIRIQHEICLTKPFSHVKWLNIKFDCNNKKQAECILDYHIDRNGVIKDGEQVYDLSLKVNTFLINGILHFLKVIEEKDAESSKPKAK